MRSSTLITLGALMLSLAACDKSTGDGQKAAGHLESAVGSVTDDAKLKREGRKDEVVGGVKSAAGEVKDAAKAATR